jgi:hypothetical protein
MTNNSGIVLIKILILLIKIILTCKKININNRRYTLYLAYLKIFIIYICIEFSISKWYVWFNYYLIKNKNK